MKDEQEWFKCNYCGKEFLTKQRMEDHRHVVHLGKGSPLVDGCLHFLFKVFWVLFVIAIVVLGAMAHYEYHKMITKKAIEESRTK